MKDDMFETFDSDSDIESEGYSIEDIPESDDDDFGFDTSDDYSEEDE